MKFIPLVTSFLFIAFIFIGCSKDSTPMVDDQTTQNTSGNNNTSGNGGQTSSQGLVSAIEANVSPSGVMVSWLKASNENRWTVEYGETGFTQGNGTSGDNAASIGPFGVTRISGLSASTTYDLYIAVAGASNSAVVSFTTLNIDESVYSIFLNDSLCTVNIEQQLDVSSSYVENVNGNVRSFSINDIPNHLVGTFPTPQDRRIGNPNTISAQDNNYSTTTQPVKANTTTEVRGYVNGVLFSGVGVEVYTAERFTGFTGQTNTAWTRTGLQSMEDLGLDCNNAHVQPTGQYHYHGLPNAYGTTLEIDGTQMVKIGYAADGFPYYYLYFQQDNGTMKEATASYALKSGTRGGNGITAPSGTYDGEYFEDFEFVNGSGDLDECNGRFGSTPDNADGEYYYVVTKNFPSFPLCFSGTPDDSFRFGGGGPP